MSNCYPCLATILLPISGDCTLKDTTDPTSRLGYGLLMRDASPFSGRMKDRICAYFEASLGRYSPQEQERIRKMCPPAR